MSTDQVHAAPAAEAASRLRAHEDEIRVHAREHSVAWGDGPPYFSEGSVEFWRALAAGTFHLGRCTQCEHIHFPPRLVCPRCWSIESTRLHPTPGLARLVTFTELHVVSNALRPIAPVCLAVLDLDEGVRLLTWLRGTPPAQARVGDRCRIEVETLLDRPWFVARIIED